MIVEHDTSVESAEEGENYFVSMTDMMVGILFIFIIMLMVFALDFRTRTDAGEEAIELAAELSLKLEALQTKVHAQIEVLNRADETRHRLLQELRDQLEAEGLNVKIDEVSGVLRLTDEAIRFGSNQSELDTRAQENVGKIARVLNNVLPRYAACYSTAAGSDACSPESNSTVETVFIEGHTDSTGGDELNWPLSTQRAVNTYRAFMNAAPALRSLQNRQKKQILSVSGYSSTRPISAEAKSEDRVVNRRIDLRFLMEVDIRQRLSEILKLTDAMKDEIDTLKQVSGASQ